MNATHLNDKSSTPVELGKGLDVGTAFIYGCEKVNTEVLFRIERDAFVDIPSNDYAKAMFEKENVRYIQEGDKLYIIGNDALRFADMVGHNTRRPLKTGVINPKEEDALPIIQLIIKQVISSPRSHGETVYYSVPAKPVDADFDVLYHERVLHGLLSRLGYTPKPINEGLAIIFSELADENFSGLAFSFGGGMVNVTLANLSLPIFTFSVARGGDWIDKQVARVTNRPRSQVTAWKESSLDLEKKEDLSRIEQAFSIYYDLMLEYTMEHFRNEMQKASIHLERPLTVIISGGTAIPHGFLKRFQENLGRLTLPIEVREVRLASHLLRSVGRGALIAAIADEAKK